MRFELLARDGAARRGRMLLAHGAVETPAFMPVGTYGAVKGMRPGELESIDTHILLGNTFHLWLRPGVEVVSEHGGLHRFIGWQRPILTDSGGFRYSVSEHCARLPKKVSLFDRQSMAHPVSCRRRNRCVFRES